MRKVSVLLVVAIALAIGCSSASNPTYAMEKLSVEDEMYMCFGCGDIIGVVKLLDNDLGFATPDSPRYESWATRLLAEVDRVLISSLDK